MASLRRDLVSDARLVSVRIMLATVTSAATHGIDGLLVSVEVHVGRGLPAYHVVGLPDAAVRESRERVAAALQGLGYRLPPSRLTINLAPAGVRKAGPSFDVPIALGILQASGQLRWSADVDCAVAGELALDGRLRPIRGAVCLASAVAAAGIGRFIVPQENAPEAALAAGLRVHGVGSLAELVTVVRRLGRAGEPAGSRPLPLTPAAAVAGLDLSDVRGQERAKRALAIAAAGAHHLLLLGPPGAGKTMLARRLVTLLPPMVGEEPIQVTKIASIAGLRPDGPLVSTRPFRAPHHTTTRAGMVGGGQPVRPGEISLAHHGILFLDELPEFSRSTLEVLRQPLEDGMISVVRASGTTRFPARFMLVAAMNPCPCGYRGDVERGCDCSPIALQRYMARISGPLLDRIDLHVEVARLRPAELLDAEVAPRQSMGCLPPSSELVRARVESARRRAAARHGAGEVRHNAELGVREVHRYCELDVSSRRLLGDAMRHLGFSARACHRVMKVALSIADLDGSARIRDEHVAEAITYRVLDRRRTAS